jgi:hypothetical protein
MKLYIAGPMRGIPEFNFPAFRAAAERLRAQGHEVWSPAENDARVDGFDGTGEPKTLEYRHYMRRDLPAVLEADAVAVLDGWERSKGARMEVHVARECGIPVLDAGTLEPIETATLDLPDRARGDIEDWLYGEQVELSDDAICKLADAAGRPFTHVTAGFLRQLLAAAPVQT